MSWWWRSGRQAARPTNGNSQANTPLSAAQAGTPLSAAQAGLDAPSRAKGPLNVLILSASMGAGHDGAAREVAARLEAGGHHTEIRDCLDAAPLGIGSALRGGYEFELRHVPAAYDATYRFWYRVPWLAGPLAWFVSFLAGRSFVNWARAADADVVVSTYPLATLALGRLRARGRLTVPVANFITDFGVHPLWVHPGVDLNLAVHAGPAEHAESRSGRPSIACGPAVNPAFDPGPEPSARRANARRRMGIGPEERAVLVVAGSWGVGGLLDTFRSVAVNPSLTPVVVCGQDGHMRQIVEEEAASIGTRAVVFGWTDEMADLMSACDALVENAGGLTSLEAMRSGLPVVSYRPIAGHGRENTSAMARAGVSRLAVDETDLDTALIEVTRDGVSRQSLVKRGQAMFESDPAGHVVDLALGVVPAPVLSSTAAGAVPGEAEVAAGGRRRAPTLVRAVAAISGVAAFGWGGMTIGAGAAAASGVGVARVPTASGPVAYIGVRLTAQELMDRQVQASVTKLRSTAVVDDSTASADPQDVSSLAQSGVDVESGGWGDGTHHQSPDKAELWTRAHRDIKSCSSMTSVVGHPINEVVPGRSVNGWDMIEARSAHVKLVVPNRDMDDPSDVPSSLTARRIYVVDGLRSTPQQLVGLLGQTEASLTSAGLAGVPLDRLS